MKLDFAAAQSGPNFTTNTARFAVQCESDPLAEVLVCLPSHLAPVPCCSKTCESMRAGFELSTTTALREHRALQETLTGLGVTCRVLPAAETMPDLCFTRDAAVTTPWGIVALNPAKRHRAVEVDHTVAALGRWGAAPAARIAKGHIEGGDVCIARPGLLILGISGERTDEAGAREFAAPFLSEGWDVVECNLDPHFLHLDTVFCMLDRNRALACVDVLNDGFLSALAGHGIELVPTTYKEARDLGGNILSIDGETILTSADHPRVSAELRSLGYRVIEIDISQFAACGGGLHCLTMPLSRRNPA